MRLTEAFAYLDEPTKPQGERLLRYTHLQITEELEAERRRRQVLPQDREARRPSIGGS